MLVVHALTVLAVLAAGALGVWQYGAWQNGREDQAAALVETAPRPLTSVMTADQAFPGRSVGQPVTLAGRWVPRSTVYVADRLHAGRDGFWAVTPVALCDGGAGCRTASAMLVVRGWSPTVAAAPQAPTGRVRVTGWLQPGEGSGLGDPDPTDDVIPEMRVADALQRIDQDLYGGYVIARSTEPSSARGLTPVTPASLPKATAFTSVRNFLYALEWWVFGGFAVYVWWRWCRDELARDAGVPSEA